jgi:hypothetical protein
VQLVFEKTYTRFHSAARAGAEKPPEVF